MNRQGRLEMKHFRRITVARAEYTAEEINGFLDRVFGFVTTMVRSKGKGGTPEALCRGAQAGMRGGQRPTKQAIACQTTKPQGIAGK
jgi:hypothetical protein